MKQNLTEGKPLKLILSFSVPLILGNMIQQLYSMADAVIVGKTIGKAALGAVGLTHPIGFLVLGLVMGLTSGFGVVVAQKFGAKDEQGVRRAWASSVVLSAAFTVLITLAGVLTVKPMLRLMETPDTLFGDAYNYIAVIFLGTFANTFYNLISNVVRALGDSKTPLIFLILSAVLNVALDFAFIVWFRMGVAGAGAATVIAQFLSGLACLLYSLKKFPVLRIRKNDFKKLLTYCYKHVAIGLPMALQFSITAIGIIVLQRGVNGFGDDVIVAFTAAEKLEALVTCALMAFGTAMATYVGQNYGAGRIDRIRQGIRSCSLVAVGVSVAATLIVVFLGRFLLMMFLDRGETEVFALAQTYLNTIGIFFFALGLLYVFRNSLQGMGCSFTAMAAGGIELVIRILITLFLPAILGYQGLCFATPLAWVGATTWLMLAYAVIIARRSKKHATDMENAPSPAEKKAAVSLRTAFLRLATKLRLL